MNHTLTEEQVLLFENAGNQIMHLTALNVLVLCLRGDVSEDDFKEANITLMNLGREHQVKWVIINELELRNIPTRARLWLTTKFMRTAEAKEGIKDLHGFIVIKSASRFATTLTKVMHQVATRMTGIKFHYHTDLQAAISFVERQSHYAR
ncbi:MAG TPA: hypothetical protein DCE41_28370 [Cytophagales bacterium]|nr:hypothetical protein [Cytophagales bacterium]HAA24007.1 hypothetical protein [Cytophagales bacterium]HAP58387.1 hypothetical protein [Cytophagales bacterium]